MASSSRGSAENELHENPFGDSGLEEARLLAALENDALAVEHQSSIRLEEDIAAEAGVNFSDDGFSCSGGCEGSKVTFTGFPSDDVYSHAASASAQMHATELIAGYNADNAFGFARAGLQNDGIKHFWETGFWSDFMDPNKTYVSGFLRRLSNDLLTLLVRLKAYLEAITFCRHVLGITEFDECTVSRRCQGVAALDVHHKSLQAEPLSVRHLETLHTILTTDAETWNRVFAGMLLFCVYARSRWSDAQHGEKLIEDMDASGQCAYIEVATGVHKTAKALQLRHVYLPLVAPCIGVVPGNWGAAWCECRRELGIHDMKQFPLMPAPDPQQIPTVRPLSSTEAGSWMRDLLQINHDDKSVRFSSHSLKSTCLSYAAKRGCSFEDRLSLGYHTQHLKMALVYSRDGSSRPLRVLESILKEIRTKVFNPNDTRSGRLSNLPDLHSDVQDIPNVESVDSFELVSPVNSAACAKVDDSIEPPMEEAEVSDHATTGSETESDVETTVKPKVSYRDTVAPEGTRLYQHVKLKTLHLMKNENRVVFLCGRKTSGMYQVAQPRHPFDTPKCRVEFAFDFTVLDA
eukprot:s5228_g2.t1